MTEQTAVETNESTLQKAGKYLTFALGDEEYGLEILKVREIIGMMDITSVPRTPDYVKGVLNLRGKVIPVIDIRLKFQMPEAAKTHETCVVVVQVDGCEMGIVVDRVSDVIDISAGQIDQAPKFGQMARTDFILGIGKVDGSVRILLDIDKVLDSEDLIDLADLSTAPDATETSEQLNN